MKQYIFIITMILLPISASLAQTSCVTPPTCAEMGYTQTESECAGKEIVRCPFDLSVVFCPNDGCDFSEYPLTECPANATCLEFTCGSTTQYQFAQCEIGYIDYDTFWCPQN
ncbi:MAG: hypothetical protein E7012_00575 [Alphaproteobacteria bacterium]|nr:hypothetical protein [Alphaproteobacteria bacterium]